MNRHLLECISIALEVLAFFFVTVDLYGEKRLTEWRNRIIAAQKIEGKNEATFTFNNFFSGAFLISVFVLVIFSFYFMIGFANKMINKIIGLITPLQEHPIIKYILMALLFLAAISISLFIVVILSVLFINVLLEIVEGLIYLVRVKPLKNRMLPIGTVLFIISKVIAIYNIFHF